MSNKPDDKQIKVVLVEDHPMFRERLVLLINKDRHMTVCGEADNVLDAMRVIETTDPDIAIVDITLQGSSGLKLIKDLRSRSIHLPVLVLSMHDESLYAERAFWAGARGYITKNQAASQVKLAIDQVLRGEVYFSPQMAAKILQKVSKGSAERRESGIASLSDREIEVFRLLGCGFNSREVAEQMHLEAATVNSYRFRIREKLGTKNAADLYNQAARWVLQQEM